MNQDLPGIVVAGDIALDWLQVDCPLREDDPWNWRKSPGYRWHQCAGGALLVAHLLAGGVKGPVHSYNFDDLKGSPSETILHSLARVVTDMDDKESTVLRVQQYLGYSGPADAGQASSPDLRTTRQTRPSSSSTTQGTASGMIQTHGPRSSPTRRATPSSC